MAGGAGTDPGSSLPAFRRAALVAVLAVSLFLGGGLGLWKAVHPSPAPADFPGRVGQSLAERPVVDVGSLASAIATLQDRLRRLPEDWRALADLGLAYVQQARVTSDPSFYPKAEAALRRSLALHGEDNFEAFTGMGALAAARHDFVAALRWGEHARRANPGSASVYGVIGDAEVELGRYEPAFRTLQKMVDLKPSLSSYARASYALELQGDVAGAIRVMRLALDAAGSPEDAAFASFQLGELYFNSGRLGPAESYYRRGVELAPNYFPPQAGLAKVAWARGDLERAMRLYRAVVRRYPSPEYVAALGDLYRLSGRTRDAERQYGLVRAEERLFRANGVNVDLELALFDADHGRPTASLRAAQAEWGRRHSVHVADALAWALHANGRDGEAHRYARKAIALGYRNALFFFHKAAIEAALGRTAAARADLRTAIRVNPHFSILHASEAARMLRTLERPVG